jgi:hypothetical protein
MVRRLIRGRGGLLPQAAPEPVPAGLLPLLPGSENQGLRAPHLRGLAPECCVPLRLPQLTCFVLVKGRPDPRFIRLPRNGPNPQLFLPHLAITIPSAPSILSVLVFLFLFVCAAKPKHETTVAEMEICDTALRAVYNGKC